MGRFVQFGERENYDFKRVGERSDEYAVFESLFDELDGVDTDADQRWRGGVRAGREHCSDVGKGGKRAGKRRVFG